MQVGTTAPKFEALGLNRREELHNLMDRAWNYHWERSFHRRRETWFKKKKKRDMLCCPMRSIARESSWDVEGTPGLECESPDLNNDQNHLRLSLTL